MVVAAVAAVGLAVLLLPSISRAHSLDSSTVSVRVSDDSVTATISVAVATLDEALGGDFLGEDDVDAYAEEVVSYFDEHLTVSDADGVVWAETYSELVRETVERIESLSVEVEFDLAGSTTAVFTLAYDAIIEAVPGHRAVVVLTDADGEVSSPGIIEQSGDTIEISAAAADVSIGDMIEYGFAHVLEGADHLLFLITLLLPAPLVIVAGRWQRGGRIGPTIRHVIHVVTAFTIGHSVTLIASAVEVVSLPSRPVEVVIAASVGVSAIHAIRPLAARGEMIIAFVFGLVHGLAFARILTELGLDGSTSVLALLAFNIGIELAQLATIALIFPALYIMSRTRLHPAFRVAGASLALVAASVWAIERTGVSDNPLSSVEEALIAHPWRVVLGLASVAVTAWVIERCPWAGSGGRPHLGGIRSDR